MPDKPIEELKAAIGESHETVEDLRVERGKVLEFASAVGEDPADLLAPSEGDYDSDAMVAPLTFTRVSYFPHHRPEGIDTSWGFDLGLDPERIVHGEQSYEYERPVEVGDVLSGTTTLVDVSQREGKRGGSMTFVTYETAYYDADDELVLTERFTRIEMGRGDEEGSE